MLPAGMIECSMVNFMNARLIPSALKTPIIIFFMEIKKALDADSRVKYILALVSADSTGNLKAQKECLEEEDTDCNIDFELIGREGIFGISQYVISEIA